MHSQAGARAQTPRAHTATYLCVVLHDLPCLAVVDAVLRILEAPLQDARGNVLPVRKLRKLLHHYLQQGNRPVVKKVLGKRLVCLLSICNAPVSVRASVRV